jgi:hypothetical protein
MSRTEVKPVKPDRRADYDPVVLTFDYDFKEGGILTEPCLCGAPCVCLCCYPLCLIGGCYTCSDPCKDHKTKALRIHDQIFSKYTRESVFTDLTYSFPFEMKENGKGFLATEIFYNPEAAEEYYTHFQKDKCFMAKVVANLPMRQKPGPTATHGDGNVKAYGNPATIAKAKQLVQFNHIKLEGKPDPTATVPLEAWETPPPLEEIEKQFGKFHYGWRHEPSRMETAKYEPAPVQQAMDPSE